MQICAIYTAIKTKLLPHRNYAGIIYAEVDSEVLCTTLISVCYIAATYTLPRK